MASDSLGVFLRFHISHRIWNGFIIEQISAAGVFLIVTEFFPLYLLKLDDMLAFVQSAQFLGVGVGEFEVCHFEDCLEAFALSAEFWVVGEDVAAVLERVFVFDIERHGERADQRLLISDQVIVATHLRELHSDI